MIESDSILAPIPGDNPAGEDLRYTKIYDEIKEARRADDQLDRGDWTRDIKTSDWDQVVAIATEALCKKTKDLQIAAWLTEALIKTEGFNGLLTGLKIITSFLSDYWEFLYPGIEDGDLDFRAAPLEFMNDKLWQGIKEIPLTDTKVTKGYSWLKWQESRQVGFEADTRNKHGDVDEGKKKARDELIAEGKLTAEDFDAAVNISSGEFYESLAEDLTLSIEEFKKLDDMVDEKFGSDAPRLAEIRGTLGDCEQVVMRILKEKKKHEPTPKQKTKQKKEEVAVSDKKDDEKGTQGDLQRASPPEEIPTAAADIPRPLVTQSFDAESMENSMWEEALKVLKTSGIRQALEGLFEASCHAPSIREKNRYRLLMAKLCLKAERPDLAKPIAEELHTLIEDLQLERWESPMWIAEILDTLYQCLTAGDSSDDEIYRAKELLRRLCTTDVTKAMIYGK